MALEIGLDLGTYKTVIYSGAKVVLEEPTIVTVDSDTFEPVYYGEKAKSSLGRTPDMLTCIRPIESGVISEYDIALSMLREYMFKAFGNKIIRPKIIACLPTGLSELQHHSLTQLIEESGGRSVSIVETPIAVALASGVDFDEPKGSMVVDIGFGTTDIAVISLGNIVQCDSFKTASYNFDEAIIKYVRRVYNIEIGELTAENIKKQIGSVVKRPMEITMVARGRNLITGMPETFEITSDELFEPLFDTAITICNAVRKVMEKTDPDMLSDITEQGIFLAGGGSQINGMSELLEDFLGVKINFLPDPSHSAIKGVSTAFRNPRLIKSVDYQMRSIKELTIENI